MKLKVRVIPNASKTSVEEGDVVHVKLTAHPDKGKANAQLIEVLSEHYKIPKSKIKIIKGLTSRNKIVEIGI